MPKYFVFFFGVGIILFLWFQLEVETFQVGWAVPAEEVGLKKKNAGLPPGAFAEHAM